MVSNKGLQFPVGLNVFPHVGNQPKEQEELNEQAFHLSACQRKLWADVAGHGCTTGFGVWTKGSPGTMAKSSARHCSWGVMETWKGSPHPVSDGIHW